MRLTKISLAFFYFFGKIDTENQRKKERMETASTLVICTSIYLYKYEKKGGAAMITIKDIKGIFNQLRKILAMLDKIYHAMGLDKEE